jgi:hypothetical protein
LPKGICAIWLTKQPCALLDQIAWESENVYGELILEEGKLNKKNLQVAAGGDSGQMLASANRPR